MQSTSPYVSSSEDGRWFIRGLTADYCDRRLQEINTFEFLYPEYENIIVSAENKRIYIQGGYFVDGVVEPGVSRRQLKNRSVEKERFLKGFIDSWRCKQSPSGTLVSIQGCRRRGHTPALFRQEISRWSTICPMTES